MKLKIKLSLFFIILYSLFMYQNISNTNKRIQQALEVEIKNLKIHYNLTMSYFLQDAKSIRENIQNNQEIINIFAQAQNKNKIQRKILRDKLYKLLIPLYTRIHKRGILQFHFVFPNNISFLRMHKVSKYGDDLTDIRYSFKQVNMTKKTVIGFEQGRTTHAFRYVFPFYDKQCNYLGAVETSLSSYFIQNKLLDGNKIHSHFLVNKKIFYVKAWETKDLIQKYIPSIEDKDYMFALTKDFNKSTLRNIETKFITPLKEKISYNLSLKKPFSLYLCKNQNKNIITFLPIKNAENKEVVAYLVSYTKNNNILNILNSSINLSIIVLISILLLFYFIYRNLNYKIKLEHINYNLREEIKIEVDKNREKEKQLLIQSRLVQMGEMISMIAHQWRQPLSNIGASVINIQMKLELKKYDLDIKEEREQFIDILKLKLNNISLTIQDLSSTITDFRNFFKPNKQKDRVRVTIPIQRALEMVKVTINAKSINIKTDYQTDDFILMYQNEVMQVILNIIKNSEDNFVTKSMDNKTINIITKKIDNNYIIEISDNGGGIPKDIIDNVFDPYFSTKIEKNGTGLGLYISKTIIEEHCDGLLTVENINNGVKFMINFRQ